MKYLQLFEQFLIEKKPEWQGGLSYSQIDLRGFSGRVGLTLGRFFGGIIRGYKDARKKT